MHPFERRPCWIKACDCTDFVDERDTGHDEPSLASGVMGVVQNLGADVLEPCLDAVEGYRSKLVGLGYPADAAANMAADYHRLLLAAFTSDSTGERRTTT